ncbi:MAG: hypothetical protein ACC630_07090 [Nitrospinota bacterium]
MRDKMGKRDLKDIEIEIIPYDGTPNPRNPYDRLTPEERHRKIVELYGQLYLKIMEKRNQNNFGINKIP